MAIERKFIEQNMREFQIKEFVEQNLSRVGLSDVKLKKTPLGDKIVVHASRPGLVVGRGGENIQLLTKQLNKRFNLENAQIEIEEIPSPDLDADIVCERILNSLERFGSGRTKGIGHRTMTDVMNAGALGVEILISGKIPSMRARRWRFYMGYLKKAGDLAVEGVDHSIKSATLKSGAVGIQVRIMPPSIKLPDHITLTEQVTTVVEETTEPEVAEATEETPTEETSAEAPEAEAKAEETPVTETTSETTEKSESVPETKDSGTEDKNA